MKSLLYRLVNAGHPSDDWVGHLNKSPLQQGSRKRRPAPTVAPVVAHLAWKFPCRRCLAACQWWCSQCDKVSSMVVLSRVFTPMVLSSTLLRQARLASAQFVCFVKLWFGKSVYMRTYPPDSVYCNTWHCIFTVACAPRGNIDSPLVFDFPHRRANSH